MQIPVKRLDYLVLALRIGGLGYAIYNVLQFFVGNQPNEIQVTHDDIYLHGIPIIRVFYSFLIIAVGSVIDSIRNVYQKHKQISN